MFNTTSQLHWNWGCTFRVHLGHFFPKELKCTSAIYVPLLLMVRWMVCFCPLFKFILLQFFMTPTIFHKQIGPTKSTVLPWFNWCVTSNNVSLNWTITPNILILGLSHFDSQQTKALETLLWARLGWLTKHSWACGVYSTINLTNKMIYGFHRWLTSEEEFIFFIQFNLV